MSFAFVPMQKIGPVHVINEEDNIDELINVPLATYESPLWPSTNRGAKISRLAKGIKTTIIDERMTRSVLLEAKSASQAKAILNEVKLREADLHIIVSNSSRYAKLLAINSQIIGSLLFIRLEFSTGDASGHNMATQCAQDIMEWILVQYPELKYISVSGNMCTDKKVSAINGILGRGKNVIAEIIISKDICTQHLHTDPEKIIELNLKKNYIGSTIAGGLRTANAHFANMLLAFYLATGQDAANIVEGSQGFVYADKRGEDLYFSVTIPNLILGTVGNGKDLDFVQENLESMGCKQKAAKGMNARKLSIIAAATILCGELSLMAALTNPKELMQSHTAIERKRELNYRTAT